MTSATPYFQILKRWQTVQPQLQAALDHDWPAFQQRVTTLLAQLHTADIAGWERLFRQLLNLDMDFPPTADILRQLRVAYKKITSSDRLDPLRSGGEKRLPEMSGEASAEEVRQELTAVWKASQKPTVVNTGFASHHAIGQPIPPTTTLQANGRYYFWLDIDLPNPASIEKTPTPLPLEELPPLPVVQVVVSAVPNELALTGATQGALQLLADGTAVVKRAANAPPGATDLARRLYFAVQAPAEPGTYRLRCDIYHEQVLIQGRLVQAVVTAVAQTQAQALTSTIDHSLAELRAADMPPIPTHGLSMAMRHDSQGTHSFALFGKAGNQQFANHIYLTEGKLTTLLETGRKLLHRVAWGTETEWRGDDDQEYRYAVSRPLNSATVRADLGRLARWGYTFFRSLVTDLGGAQQAALEQALQGNGFIQFTSHHSAALTLPLSLLYDYPLDTGRSSAEYSLCPTFLQAVEVGQPWEEMDCLCGRCPSKEVQTIVCPSGFWGYRYALGMPIATPAAPTVATTISYTAAPDMIMAVSTDDAFTLRLGHERKLRQLWQGEWHHVTSRDKMLAMFKEQAAHLVYFYCHGGWVGPDVPALFVGEAGEAKFTRDNLAAYAIRWPQRPLVFINGCHTAALRPTTVGDFATGFVEDAHAAGVIGTEITIFESLAKEFAEAFVPEFAKGTAVGEAVRLARLALLRQGNPLGLVYIPYALATLRLTPTL